MANIFGGSKEQQTYVYLSFFSCILASICSLIVLWLIRRMRLKNGNILLIETMSWFQLMYDMTQFPSAVNVGNGPVNNIAAGMNYFSGIGSALTSNVLALVAFYVVKYVKVIDIYGNYPLILAAVSLPGLIDAILYTMSCHSPYEYLNFISTAGMYFYIRLISIIINFIVCSATVGHLWQRRSKNAQSARSISINAIDKMSVSERALRTLAFRMINYPIIQAVSRAAVTWYELQYGFNFDPSHMSTSQFIGMCCFAIFLPSASYGYLAIFLWTQPDAYECLKCTLTGKTFIPKRSTNCSDLISLGTATSSLHRSTGNSSLYNTNVIEIDNRPTFEVDSSTVAVTRLSDVDDGELFNLAKNGMSMGNIGNHSSIVSAGGGLSMHAHSVGGAISDVDIELPRPSIGLTDVSEGTK